jgi:hypothetical protein
MRTISTKAKPKAVALFYPKRHSQTALESMLIAKRYPTLPKIIPSFLPPDILSDGTA